MTFVVLLAQLWMHEIAFLFPRLMGFDWHTIQDKSVAAYWTLIS